MHPRTREQLEGMTPERRAKAEALMAKHRTAEARARQSKAVDAIETEVEKTGGITTADGTFHRILTAQSVGVDLARVGRELRVRREALGLSLDDAARSSGVEGGAGQARTWCQPEPHGKNTGQGCSCVGRQDCDRV